MKLVDGIHHVALKTHDLEKTVPFYTTILGMKLIRTGKTDEPPHKRHYYFDCGNNTCISFIEDPEAKNTEHLRKGEMHRIAFRVKNYASLKDVRMHLIKKKIEVSSIIDHDAVHSFYLFDPNGILIEIAAPPAKTHASKRGTIIRSKKR